MPDGSQLNTGPSLAPFDWADPFRLTEQLTEDERMVAESARSFAEDVLRPFLAENAPRYPQRTVAQLHDLDDSGHGARARAPRA